MLSQPKNMIGVCMLRAFEIRLRPRSLTMESFGTGANQSVGIASPRPWCPCNSADRLWKELHLSRVLFGKTFRLEVECEDVSDFTSQLQANRVDEELFRKYKLSELGLFAVHYKDGTRLSLETLRCYRQPCPSSWMTSYINCIMKILFEFLHLKISKQH